MNPLEFSIHSIKELRNLLRSPSEYNLIKTSGIVRGLIFDQNQPLQLAQNYSGKKFEFYVEYGDWGSSGDEEPSKAYVFMLRGHLEPIEHLSKVGIPEYGKLPVLQTNSKTFSIKDVIKYVANKRGGVHWDPHNLSEDQQDMERVSKIFSLNDQESILIQAGYIAENVVYSAVRSGYLSL